MKLMAEIAREFVRVNVTDVSVWCKECGVGVECSRRYQHSRFHDEIRALRERLEIQSQDMLPPF